MDENVEDGADENLQEQPEAGPQVDQDDDEALVPLLQVVEGVIPVGGAQGGGGQNNHRNIQNRPYCFRRCRDPPPTLYQLSMKVVLRRYHHTHVTNFLIYI